jgi:glycosyltransferase involved in cell wall biosynthesis
LKYKITIITVCLNSCEAIIATCESISKQQNDANFEWIVIDGGSTDGTLDILDKYKDLITILVSEPDNGIYDAMNKGILHAKGQYLLFLNAGDSLYKSNSLCSIDLSLNSDLIVGNLFLSQSELVRESPQLLPKDYLLKGMLPHQASFFRRDIFDKYGFFDASYRIAGDYEMFSRLIQKYRVCYNHVPDIIANFDETGISSNDKFRDLRKKENNRVRWKYFPRYRYSLKSIRQMFRNFTN